MKKEQRFEFKSRVTLEFNRATNKWDVIRDSQIIGSYGGFSMAAYRVGYENNVLTFN